MSWQRISQSSQKSISISQDFPWNLNHASLFNPGLIPPVQNISGRPEGKTVSLQIVDQNKEGRGHLTFADFSVEGQLLKG